MTERTPKLRFKQFTDNWDIRQLNEVVNVIDCKHRTPEYVEQGVPVISPGTIRWGEIDLITPTKRVTLEEYESLMDHCQPKKGDLVFSRNQSIGVASFILKNERFVLGQDTVLIQTKGVDSKFNYYSLQTNFAQTQISKLSGGSTFARINLGDLRKLKVIITNSEKEQQKIASFLSAVDEKIQQLSRKKELLEQYKKGVMQQLFSGKLRFKNENGKAYPKWEEKILDNIIERTSTGLNPRKNFQLGIGNNYYITIRNISDGRLDYSNAELITDEAIDLIKKRSDLRKNDIIMASIGNVGDAYLLEEDPYNWNINESVFMIRSSNLVLPKFLYYILTNDFSKRYFESNSTGSSFKSIKLRELKLLPVPFPFKEEQQKVANFLSAIDAKIESVATQITQSQTFKKGLLQQMFV